MSANWTKPFTDLSKLQEHGNLKEAFQSTKKNMSRKWLKKYDINGLSVKTLMVPPNNLGPDLSGKPVNETQYRTMIGSLMYITTSRPDIQFFTCLCVRYQANPKESHLIVVKRIFRKRTLCTCQLLGGKLVYCSDKKQQSVAMSSIKAKYVAAVRYKYFAEYTGIEVTQFRETLLQHMSNVKKSVAERTRHQRQYDRRVNKRQMQTQESYREEIGAKGTLKKSCLTPRWRLLMAQIMHRLKGKIGGLDQISNKDATILYCLANGVKVDYAKIIWEDLMHKLNKKTRKEIVPYPRFLSLLLEHMIPEYENEKLTINLP
nr:hypothetical protein [Tanacetum cinerariifolium]